MNDPITTNEVNVMGTLNNLDAAKDAGVRRISTPPPPQFTVTTPNSLKEKICSQIHITYAVSKLAGEILAGILKTLWKRIISKDIKLTRNPELLIIYL